jgi:hypothetical protein
MLEEAKYEVLISTKVAGENYEFYAKICLLCMPVESYLLKEYKCL